MKRLITIEFSPIVIHMRESHSPSQNMPNCNLCSIQILVRGCFSNDLFFLLQTNHLLLHIQKLLQSDVKSALSMPKDDLHIGSNEVFANKCMTFVKFILQTLILCETRQRPMVIVLQQVISIPNALMTHRYPTYIILNTCVKVCNFLVVANQQNVVTCKVVE